MNEIIELKDDLLVEEGHYLERIQSVLPEIHSHGSGPSAVPADAYTWRHQSSAPPLQI